MQLVNSFKTNQLTGEAQSLSRHVKPIRSGSKHSRALNDVGINLGDTLDVLPCCRVNIANLSSCHIICGEIFTVSPQDSCYVTLRCHQRSPKLGWVESVVPLSIFRV